MNIKIKSANAENSVFINSISKETLQNLSQNLFRGKDDFVSPFIEHLEIISSRCKQEHITLPDNIQNILSELNNQAFNFALEKNAEIENGNIPANKELFNSQFYEKNKDSFKLLQDFFAQYPITQSVSKYFEALKKNKSSMLFNPKISKISDNLEIGKRIYYHGERPFKPTNDINDIRTASCLGAGLYCTPHRDLAGSYAGLRGKISRYKLCSEKIAIVNQEQMVDIVGKIVDLLKINNKNIDINLVDAIIMKLFQFNGYDIAYVKEEISNWSDNIKNFYDKLAYGKNEEIAIYSQQAVQELHTNTRTKIMDKFYQTYGIIRKKILSFIY